MLVCFWKWVTSPPPSSIFANNFTIFTNLFLFLHLYASWLMLIYYCGGQESFFFFIHHQMFPPPASETSGMLFSKFISFSHFRNRQLIYWKIQNIWIQLIGDKKILKSKIRKFHLWFYQVLNIFKDIPL